MRIVDLLAILAKKYRERIGQPPNKTKLIKLAYLAEVYYRRITGERLTEQEWIYWKFGPYFFEYEKLLNDSSVFIKPDRRDEFYPVELTEEYELAATTLDTNTALFRAIEHASDDLNDIPAMQEAGVAIAVANAAMEVKAAADFVTEKSGGRGAVREVIEMILKAQGKWEEGVQAFLHELQKEQERGEAPGAIA